jgi:tetratricopeptide (TPR) repeat protein
MGKAEGGNEYFRQMFKRTTIIFFFLFFGFNCCFAQGPNLEVKGKIFMEDNKTPLEDVKIKLFQNDLVVSEMRTEKKGDLLLNLYKNNQYLVEFSKDGFITKGLLFDLYVPDRDSNIFSQFEFKMTLYKSDSAEIENKNFIPGLIAYDPSIKNFKSFKVNNYDFGVKSYEAKDYERAIIYFTRSIKEKQNLIDSYFNRGACYKKTGKINEACADWQKSKELGDKESEELINKYCGAEKKE